MRPANRRRFRSAPPASLPATATSSTVRGRGTIAAHFIAHPLAIVLRHLPPLLPAVVTKPLAVVLRHLPPLLTHFLTHLATLVRRHLRLHGSRHSRKG
jgi:hypothetical protein